jgi:3-dehydroquinate synthase
MFTYVVQTPQRSYPALVGRGVLDRLGDYIPAGVGKLFILSTYEVWTRQCTRLARGLAGYSHEVLLIPGGEEHKRLQCIEHLAEEMAIRGGDRSSLVIAFGGGVVNDMGGFLAAIFMRGVQVIQLPTTLLAQVDAGIGGKTGVDLVAGKNLVGVFHQPLAVLIDPEVLATLPEREYRGGLFEVVKCGIIRSPELFTLLDQRREEVLARKPDVVEQLISECVRIKAEVVSDDERDTGLRRILNFGHTVGHALEAETGYSRFVHGEAVGFGMRAAVHLAVRTGHVAAADAEAMLRLIEAYGPVPSLEGITADALAARLLTDKKTIKGQVHFVLPERIGQVTVVTGIADDVVRAAIREALG